MNRAWAIRTVLCLAISAWATACALGDELEDLLSNQAIPPADSALSGAEGIASESGLPSEARAVPGPEASAYGQRADWQMPPDAQPRRAADSPDSSPDPPSSFNAVPEPSAIVLALVALVYFLLFGRRRRVS
jgi:hypothetical protein